MNDDDNGGGLDSGETVKDYRHLHAYTEQGWHGIYMPTPSKAGMAFIYSLTNAGKLITNVVDREMGLI